MSVATMNTSTDCPQRPRKPRLAILGLNLLALGALVTPAVLILGASGKIAARQPVLFDSALALMIVGVTACIAAMLLMTDRRERSGGVTLVLPVALVALLGGVGLLVGIAV